MSSNKDFLPSSSLISSVGTIEIKAILQVFSFSWWAVKVFIPRMYYNYRIENQSYEEPAAILFTSDTSLPSRRKRGMEKRTQEKNMHSPFPPHSRLLRRLYRYKKDGIPPPPVGLSWDSPPPPPESVRTGVRTYVRTLTSEPNFLGSTGYQICFPMVLRELR